jgi:hypothetical protein
MVISTFLALARSPPSACLRPTGHTRRRFAFHPLSQPRLATPHTATLRCTQRPLCSCDSSTTIPAHLANQGHIHLGVCTYQKHLCATLGNGETGTSGYDIVNTFTECRCVQFVRRNSSRQGSRVVTSCSRSIRFTVICLAKLEGCEEGRLPSTSLG